MMEKKQKSKKKIGKPNALLFTLGYLALKGRYTRKYGITFDNGIVKDIKGPAIVVATHTSDVDHILSAMTLYPIRPTYIVSEHFMHNPSTARLLKLMHVIPKKMFTPDASTIVKILRAKHEDAVIVIFPEGRLSAYGHTLPITDGTAELIKKLGVNLYSWKAEGAYLTFPKWRDKGDVRPGKINASVKLLLSADEIAERSLDEVRRVICEAIHNDDEISMAGITYKSREPARGVDKILFKCPECEKEDTITVEGGHIKCSCGLDATLDEQYRLHGVRFERINEWFEWQQESIDVENECISSSAQLGCCKEDGFMDSAAGEGEVYIDKNTFRLSGTMHGEHIEFEIDPEKIVAFPTTPGDHFDIYHNGRLIYISPKPSPRMTIKWVCFLDKLMAEKRKQTT